MPPDERTPDYARSDFAAIVGYLDPEGVWHYVDDEDWRPPAEEDLEVGDRYLIELDNEGLANVPGMVQWIGPIDGISLDDIYDYYAAMYEELAG